MQFTNFFIEKDIIFCYLKISFTLNFTKFQKKKTFKILRLEFQGNFILINVR